MSQMLELSFSLSLIMGDSVMARFYIIIYRDAYEELLRLLVSCDGLYYSDFQSLASHLVAKI